MQYGYQNTQNLMLISNPLKKKKKKKLSAKKAMLCPVKFVFDFLIYLNSRLCRLAGSSVKEAKMLEKCRGLQALSSSSPSRSGFKTFKLPKFIFAVFLHCILTDLCSSLSFFIF
jgi:hypothetical protein